MLARMPELPDVEYVRKHLSRWIGHGRIDACKVHDARIVRPHRPRTVEHALVGHAVRAIERRGKWLRLSLEGGGLVFSHLGMTGWFELAPDDAPLRFERVRLTIARGKKLARVVYVDARRFGRVLVADEDVRAWSSLGPDPLDDEIDLDAVHARLAKWKKRAIKDALMDQRLLAGVGNIHATEAVWKARIDPRRRAGAIDRKDLAAIMKGVRWTIDRALLDLAKGDDGARDPFLVYGHAGKPCPRCRTTLVKTQLGGRTTTYCPRCQK
jgi:formamidopyrimidine-DNA glycosylase